VENLPGLQSCLLQCAGIQEFSDRKKEKGRTYHRGGERGGGGGGGEGCDRFCQGWGYPWHEGGASPPWGGGGDHRSSIWITFSTNSGEKKEGREGEEKVRAVPREESKYIQLSSLFTRSRRGGPASSYSRKFPSVGKEGGERSELLSLTRGGEESEPNFSTGNSHSHLQREGGGEGSFTCKGGKTLHKRHAWSWINPRFGSSHIISTMPKQGKGRRCLHFQLYEKESSDLAFSLGPSLSCRRS